MDTLITSFIYVVIFAAAVGLAFAVGYSWSNANDYGDQIVLNDDASTTSIRPTSWQAPQPPSSLTMPPLPLLSSSGRALASTSIPRSSLLPPPPSSTTAAGVGVALSTAAQLFGNGSGGGGSGSTTTRRTMHFADGTGRRGGGTTAQYSLFDGALASSSPLLIPPRNKYTGSLV